MIVSRTQSPRNVPLPANTTVYRAITKESWLVNNKTEVDAAAFYRRSEKWDPSGVTIGEIPYAHRVAEPPLTRDIFGIISIDVDCVRAVHVAEAPGIVLDVTLDRPPHGNINTDLPFRDKDPRLAEKFASLLAECSEVHEVFDPPHN